MRAFFNISVTLQKACKMVKRIIILTDFSDNAAHAALYGCNLAKSMGSPSITLLHTFNPAALLSPNEMSSLLAPIEATGVFTNYEWAAEQIDLIKKEKLAELEHLKEKLLPVLQPGTEIGCLVEFGALTEVVNQMNRDEKADLVIMGIKGRSGIEKILIGSNATKAIEHVKCPVLIVPQQAALEVPEKILLATDLKTLNPVVLGQLDSLLENIEAKLLVLNILPEQTELASVKKNAAPFQQHFIKYTPEFHFRKNEGEDTEAAIHNFAIEHQASLIISLHHAQSFFQSLFHKSITRELAWHSTLPIISIIA